MSPHQILQFVLLSQTTVLAGMCQCVVSIYLHLSIFPAPQLWTLGSGWRMEIRDGERLWNLFYWERGLPEPESTRWIGPRKCSTLMFKENFRMAEITKWLVFLFENKFADMWWSQVMDRARQSDQRWRERAEIMTSDSYFISINKYFMSAATNFPFRLIDIPWDTKCLYHMRFKHFQDSQIKVNHSWK